MSNLNQQLSHQMLIFHRLYNEKVSRRIRSIHVDALSQAEFLLLAIALEEGEIPLVKLVARSGMKKQQVNRMVNQLEEKGLLIRQKSETNRRAVQLVPTTKARELQQQVIAEVESSLASVFSGLDEIAAGEYLQAIQTINRIMEQFPENTQ